MSEPLPTLNDMLNPDNLTTPQANPEKEKEENIKEEKKEVKQKVISQPKAKEQSVKKNKDKKKEEEEEEEDEEEEEEEDDEEEEQKKQEPKKKEVKKVEPKKEEKKVEPKKEEPKKEEPKKEEPKKEELKVEEEPKKEEPKKEDDKKDEVKLEEEPKKEEPKKEDDKKEEVKLEEEPKKEEPNKEDDKKDEPKVEEEKKKKKEAPKQPREPEPKIPTDFTELKNELNKIKEDGNALYSNKSYEEAIEKYKQGYDKLNEVLPQINRERSYNPQSEELLTLSRQIMSNLSLCYSKTEKYQESIDLDLKIISFEPNYDKSYARLFSNYLKIGKKDQAVYYGNGLLKFDDETKKKYEELINEINEAQKSLQAEYDAIRAKERKEMLKNIAKYAIPIIVLIAAFGIYFFYFKRKRIAK